MSKPKLIILSDIFGATKEVWMDSYRKYLSPFFEITEYDSRELAGILSSPQEEVHSGFVNGGIDHAVLSLQRLEQKVHGVLGFSVGGTIAWKYALENDHSPSLYLVSATRLRNETIQPITSISLYYGEHEMNGPSSEWFDEFKINPVLIKGKSHECYKQEVCIKQVCTDIINSADV